MVGGSGVSAALPALYVVCSIYYVVHLHFLTNRTLSETKIVVRDENRCQRYSAAPGVPRRVKGAVGRVQGTPCKALPMRGRETSFSLPRIAIMQHDPKFKSNIIQSHYIEVLQGDIFMEQNMRFGLILGQLAILKKKDEGPIMSNF